MSIKKEMKVKNIIASLLLFGAVFTNTAQAIPIDFDFDGLFIGSAETLAATPSCLPGNVCSASLLGKIKTGVTLVFHKVADELPPITIIKMPTPGGLVPIPFPDFENYPAPVSPNPNSDLKISVEDYHTAIDYISFKIFAESSSSYNFSSLTFEGTNANGGIIERELVFNSVAVPETSSLILLLFGLAGLTIKRSKDLKNSGSKSNLEYSAL